jgi:hypothetical protein
VPEFPPCCVENVKKKEGVLCSWEHCKDIQEDQDFYCKESGQNPCAAVPQKEFGKRCFCCCSCFAYDTPIEASKGEYVMVQDIVANVDEILSGSYKAGDAGPVWERRVCEYSAGIHASPGEDELEFDYMYYIAYQVEDGSQPPQFILTTIDHLFLRPNGKVTPVQLLAPDDVIVSSHGGFSRVRFVVPAKYKGGLHHLTFAGFDNETLDSHLISANGVVTADYSVQLAYSNGTINPALVDAPKEDAPRRATEDAYRARYASPAALDFIADKSQWPAGMTPMASQPMVNVPMTARSFLTADQADDVQAKAPMLTPDNTAEVTTALWLFTVFSAFFHKPICLVDWHNETPNAYTWEVNRQTFILLTGGLLRVETLSQDGLALVLAHQIAVAGGIECVGPADYDAVFFKTREVWRDSLFFSTFDNGYSQIEKLFGYVSEEHAKANPSDRCNQPSLACRLEAMEAAASMRKLPACANPDVWFGLVSARTGRQLHFVSLQFNSELNKETAETTDNYKIASEGEPQVVTVESAVLLTNRTEVRLRVSRLAPHTDYKVVVGDVLSASEAPIDPAHNSAEFRTGRLQA